MRLHNETVSHILIGSGCQTSNFPDKHVLKSGFYPMGVNNVGKAVIMSQVQVNLSQAFAASAKWGKLQVTTNPQAMQILVKYDGNTTEERSHTHDKD